MLSSWIIVIDNEAICKGNQLNLLFLQNLILFPLYFSVVNIYLQAIHLYELSGSLRLDIVIMGIIYSHEIMGYIILSISVIIICLILYDSIKLNVMVLKCRTVPYKNTIMPISLLKFLLRDHLRTL